MKLSELVAVREHLRTIYDTSGIANSVDGLVNQLADFVGSVPDSNLQSAVTDLALSVRSIHNRLYTCQPQYDNIIQALDQQISEVSSKFFSENYHLELNYSNVDNIRKVRVMPISEQLRNEIATRIRLYTDWKYPALEIGCRDGEWTQFLVAADPLYIVDYYREFTESATQNFTDEYKQRIRVYLSQDHDLSVLPAGQFNFVFSWNHINYLSLDTLKQYLKSVWNLLRPGGTFMFSYNNGDTEAGAGYAESYFMSYIPKSMLIPLCESLGFTITMTQDVLENIAVSWIEIKRPGTLTTIKAHQVMGEIKPITY